MSFKVCDDKQPPGTLGHVPVTSPQKAGTVVKLDIAEPLKQTFYVRHIYAFGGHIDISDKREPAFQDISVISTYSQTVS